MKKAKNYFRKIIIKNEPIMRILRKVKKEYIILNICRKGYSRNLAIFWYKKCREDFKSYPRYLRSTKERMHKKGYLARSIRKYNLLNNTENEYITDFEYFYLFPINNSFVKWIGDILTVNKVLGIKNTEYLRKAYFSIIRRDRTSLIFDVQGNRNKCYAEDVLLLLRNKKKLELCPSFYDSKALKYRLSYYPISNKIYINGELSTQSTLLKLINSLRSNYVVLDYLNLELNGIEKSEHFVKLYISNDNPENKILLGAYMHLYRNDKYNKRVYNVRTIDLSSGEYWLDGKLEVIKNWENIKDSILGISKNLKQVSFFSISIVLNDDGFKIMNLNGKPFLPEVKMTGELNNYLKYKFNLKRKNSKKTFTTWLLQNRTKITNKIIMLYARKGIRSYMQKLWVLSLWEDFREKNGKTLSQKIWAWKRGFFSWRIHQYNLTEDNYTNFLSDYDYHWLNRINNVYQKWIDDKTTFRYTMEPFKEYVPEYYYSVYKQNGQTIFSRMPDCNNQYEESFEGLIKLLQDKKLLAFKPSAGLHGDGFYKLEYNNEHKYLVNGKKVNIEKFRKIIKEQKSFYIITDYLFMSEELRNIYPNSINTIRMMVVNDQYNNPQILQAYMRVGSGSSGFTDNVAYGGICTKIDLDSGRYFGGERLFDHYYESCDIHPDTGVIIDGYIKNWKEICNNVKNMAKLVPELDYLGFDVAITDKGMKVLEINLHQDLHKVAEYTDEINQFFKLKIRNKLAVNNLKIKHLYGEN
ncbi:sugar-transfer associated ATP-grasp domain-containing protein [Pasteurella atlantica]|uniref:Sugar-transfer associated ATP-grasp domain-containing protein n=2 Tax=Pasteurellaceae TaxID=712 RepID=A0ACC6HND4_9PAST|nr:sugar-transfer associated ATP-grasp domain-containing protein [Pasteurella atlantica]MDP8052292.1 sugar-transfer associated ATP-grasp domain-containing protein [Pasteurella atlantica]MDP8101769.1 sugar-transfer associated ATP-grasp domain-containing protein [Pasteurella atlantica]MDP8105798.1 sugar-transfer associated ATP-grasp domain-containing protein [Pasteurella atlantica]MDP8149137.1 sugar-transfer associated ATP-grasp domain-containing protein [Pasteurella atlantica]